MTEKKLIDELEEKFQKMKANLKIKSSLESIDDIFFIKDYIAKDGFVSENLSRQICYRIVELYLSWNEYLHSLVMPNPHNILNMGESKLFSKEEREKIINLMKRIMELISRNSWIGLTRNKKEEARFIDDAVDFWEKELKHELTKMMEKINKEWGK